MTHQPLRICTFKWGNKYSKAHVARLGRMLARNLTIPWEYVVISDDPEDEAVPCPGGSCLASRYVPLWDEMRDAKLCGVRLRAFGADMANTIGARFAWVDLDVVVTGNLDGIFGRQEPFVALATPKGPLWYNGSLIMMDAGARRQVYETWTPEAYARLPGHYKALGMVAGGESDEGWMTKVLGAGEARVGTEDGIRYFKHINHQRELPKGTRLVIMNGRRFDPAMPRWQERCPWIAEHWR